MEQCPRADGATLSFCDLVESEAKKTLARCADWIPPPGDRDYQSIRLRVQELANILRESRVASAEVLTLVDEIRETIAQDLDRKRRLVG